MTKVSIFVISLLIFTIFSHPLSNLVYHVHLDSYSKLPLFSSAENGMDRIAVVGHCKEPLSGISDDQPTINLCDAKNPPRYENNSIKCIGGVSTMQEDYKQRPTKLEYRRWPNASGVGKTAELPGGEESWTIKEPEEWVEVLTESIIDSI